MKLDRIKIIAAVSFTLFVLLAYSIWNYHQEEVRLIAEIDQRLYSAAVSVPYVLADDFHDRAIDEQSISPAEDQQNIVNLTRLNKRLKTRFLYTVIRDAKGDYRLSSSSALDEEIGSGDEVRYFTPYPDVSDLLKRSFENASTDTGDFRSRLQTYRPLYVPIFSDRWGTYRSVFIPIRTASGNLYAVGADIDITYIKTLLQQNMLKSLLDFLLTILALLPVIYVYLTTMKFRNSELQRMHGLYLDKSRLSYTDSLTQIHNRLKLDEELQSAYAHFQRSGIPFGLVMIDVDHFKEVNDNYGHQVGDRVLQQFADILSQYSRMTDLIGRWGGEEFMIIYRNSSFEGAYLFAEKIRKAIEVYIFDSVNEPITASIGIAHITEGLTLEQFIEKADSALYSAKHAGRNCTRHQ